MTPKRDRRLWDRVWDRHVAEVHAVFEMLIEPAPPDKRKALNGAHEMIVKAVWRTKKYLESRADEVEAEIEPE